jgi:hypothetical protein
MNRFSVLMTWFDVVRSAAGALAAIENRVVVG